jgi:electron transfer flavoprotein beta subunit
MKILVCIKQVPDPESAFSVDAGAPRIDDASIGGFQMNRFDAHALEAALRIRESGVGARIDTVSLGPGRCSDVLKRALGMGADRAFHLLDEDENHAADPLWNAAAMAAWAEPAGYDLILTGIISEDLMQGATGPALAARLDLPWATAVVALETDPEKRTVRAEREIEGGNRDMVELRLPALLTIQSGMHTPRYPSLSNLLRAGRKPPPCIDIDPEVLPPTQQRTCRIFVPGRRRHFRTIDGSPREKAMALLGLFKESGLLKETTP